jgi:hypothetical protein
MTHRGHTGVTQGSHRGHTGVTQGSHRGHTEACPLMRTKDEVMFNLLSDEQKQAMVAKWFSTTMTD